MNDVLVGRGRDTRDKFHRGRPSEDTVKRQPRRKASVETKLANTLILDSNLQNYEKINFCC